MRCEPEELTIIVFPDKALRPLVGEFIRLRSLMSGSCFSSELDEDDKKYWEEQRKEPPTVEVVMSYLESHCPERRAQFYGGECHL